MISLEFDWQTNEFMLYCRTSQLREKSMLRMSKPCGFLSVGVGNSWEFTLWIR